MKSLLALPSIVAYRLVCHPARLSPAKIRIGYPSISSRQAQLWVAKDEGLFKNMGSMSS